MMAACGPKNILIGWASKQTKIVCHESTESLLVARGIDREIESALSDRVDLPSGGHLNIQPTEALTVIDVNSGRFTSSRTQAETVRRTNLEAAQEISRQLRLRNIGGMVIVDFIDMDSRKDQQQVLEVFQRNLEEDRAKPQSGQLSDLGLVELTRRRQGQSLRELFTVHCQSCSGLGVIPTLELGPADNKRVIAFKSHDDFVSRGKGLAGRRQKTAVLRAATAINGKVVPTIDEHADLEDNLATLPEHILEQLPDDLLQDNNPAAKRHDAFRIEDERDEADEMQEGEINTDDRSANEPSGGYNPAPTDESDARPQTEIDPITGIYRLKSQDNLEPSINETIVDSGSAKVSTENERNPGLEDWFKKFRFSNQGKDKGMDDTSS